MACRSNLTRTHAFCENFHVWKLIIMVGCLVAPYVPQSLLKMGNFAIKKGNLKKMLIEKQL